MTYQGITAPSSMASELNEEHFDVKKALRISQSDINALVDEMADPNKDLVIDGKRFKGADKTGTAAILALNNKMEQLQNQSSSIVSVFSTLFSLEKSLTQ